MERNNNTFFSNRAIFSIVVFVCFILVGAVLRIASPVILPFVIAVLLTFVMYPLVRWMDKRKVPNFLSILLVVIILVTGLGVVGVVIFTSGSNIIAVYPKYEGRVTEIYMWMGQFFDLSYDEYLSIWENIWSQLGVRIWVRNFALTFTNVIIMFIGNAVLVILFVVFILLEANFFTQKLEAAFAKRSGDIHRIGLDLMTQVMRYLTAKFFISLANGVIFAVAFHFIGLEFAILWGIIQFFLNFIPNLGSITAGVAICLFALIQFWPEPGPVIMVIAVVLIVNLILCNIFDPKIVGDRVGISPLMVLVSLAIWGWIWGFAGMVLAVPMTVIVRIICENIPLLQPVSIIIGSRKSVQAKIIEQEEKEEVKREVN